MAYAGSNRNPQSWFFSDLNDSRLRNANDVDQNGDVISCPQDIRLGVYTTAGYNESEIEMDHDKCKAQGYMMSPNDWRDVEMTGYINFTGGSSSEDCSLFARSGRHTSGRACEGTKYSNSFYPNGRMRYRMEQWHNSGYTTFDDWSVGNMEGGFVGVKFCIYNTQDDEAVVLETFLDINGTNKWERVRQFLDDGRGEEASRCSSQSSLAMTWGGPIAAFRTDGVRVDLKYFSIREIDPYNRFGGGGPSGGTGGEGIGGVEVGSEYVFNPYNPADPGLDPDLDTGSSGGIEGGGTGSGTDTPSPPPKPPDVVYMRVKLPVFYAIDMVSGAPCSINSPSENTALNDIYSPEPDEIYVDTVNYRQIGAYINTTKSIFIGEKVRQVKAIIKKSTSVTLSGDILCRIRNIGGTIVEEFPTIVDSANVTENDVEYEFNHNSPQHKIEKGDSIYIEYPSGGTVDDYLRIKISESDKEDGENTCLVTNDGTTTAVNVDKDPAFIISI